MLRDLVSLRSTHVSPSPGPEMSLSRVGLEIYYQQPADVVVYRYTGDQVLGS